MKCHHCEYTRPKLFFERMVLSIDGKGDLVIDSPEGGFEMDGEDVLVFAEMIRRMRFEWVDSRKK